MAEHGVRAVGGNERARPSVPGHGHTHARPPRPRTAGLVVVAGFEQLVAFEAELLQLGLEPRRERRRLRLGRWRLRCRRASWRPRWRGGLRGCRWRRCFGLSRSGPRRRRGGRPGRGCGRRGGFGAAHRPRRGGRGGGSSREDSPVSFARDGTGKSPSHSRRRIIGGGGPGGGTRTEKESERRGERNTYGPRVNSSTARSRSPSVRRNAS